MLEGVKFDFVVLDGVKLHFIKDTTFAKKENRAMEYTLRCKIKLQILKESNI